MVGTLEKYSKGNSMRVHYYMSLRIQQNVPMNCRYPIKMLSTSNFWAPSPIPVRNSSKFLNPSPPSLNSTSFVDGP